MANDPVFFVVDNMTEITKTEYYEARKDARKLPLGILPWGFVWSVGHHNVTYVTSDGKFYKGEMRSDQIPSRIMMFEFDGVFTHVQAVFKRKPVQTAANANGKAKVA